MSYYLTEKAQRLLNELSDGAEQGGDGEYGEDSHRSATPPRRPSHQMFTNALRCPGCGSEGFVEDMRIVEEAGHSVGEEGPFRYSWTFRCSSGKCIDGALRFRTYYVTEVKP